MTSEGLKARFSPKDFDAEKQKAIEKNFGSPGHPPEFVECPQLHGGGCVERELHYLIDHIPTVLSMCVVPYFLPGIIKKNTQLLTRSGFMKWFVGASRKTLNSSLFVLSFGVIFGSCMCILRRARKVDDRWNTTISGFFSGIAIAFENEQRRIDLILYSFSKILQILYHMLKKRNLLLPFKYGEVLIFSLSMSLLTSLYYTNPKLIRMAQLRTLFSLFVERQ